MKKKSLIVYYTCTGLTRKVVEVMKDNLKADTFEIELEKPYTKVSAYAIGMIHTHNGYLPKIKNKVDLSKYDTIFIGTPIWAYTLTPAIRSFLNDYSLEGKRVIPFCTDGGNKGKYFEDMKKIYNDMDIDSGYEFKFVNKKKDELLKEEVINWLDKVR